MRISLRSVEPDAVTNVGSLPSKIRTSVESHGENRASRQSIFDQKLPVDSVELRQLYLEEEQTWSPLRLWFRDLFSYTAFEAALVVVIVLNMVLVAVDTDYEASGTSVPAWVEGLNYFFACAFAAELGLRLFTFRSRFFANKINLLDFFVVGTDFVTFSSRALLMDDAPATLSILRVVRLVRLCKAVRAIRAFPQAHLMVSGIVMAMKSIACGMVCLFLIVLPCSVLAVQLIQPVNEQIAHPDECARCPDAFSTVMNAFVTLFQNNIAGDSWGLVTIPILFANPWTAFFFFPVFAVIGLGVLNLITAVIVDTAHQVHLKDTRHLADQKERDFDEAAGRLREMCEVMDEDSSGSLTSRELLNGFDENIEFAIVLKAMDIKRDDMEIVFSILDSDGSGDVTYDEFIRQLHMMKDHDSHTLLLFIKHHVAELKCKMDEQLRISKEQILHNSSYTARADSRTSEDERQSYSRLSSSIEERSMPSPDGIASAVRSFHAVIEPPNSPAKPSLTKPSPLSQANLLNHTSTRQSADERVDGRAARPHASPRKSGQGVAKKRTSACVETLRLDAVVLEEKDEMECAPSGSGCCAEPSPLLPASFAHACKSPSFEGSEDDIDPERAHVSI